MSLREDAGESWEKEESEDVALCCQEIFLPFCVPEPSSSKKQPLKFGQWDKPEP